MVSHLDVYPTLCDARRRADRRTGCRAARCCRSSRGEADAIHDEVFAEMHLPRRLRAAARDPHRALEVHPPLRRLPAPGARQLRRQRDQGAAGASRLGASTVVPREQLYDLVLDPNEGRNLAGDPAHAGVLAELRDRLETWMEETDDPLLAGPGRAAAGGDRQRARTSVSPAEPAAPGWTPTEPSGAMTDEAGALLPRLLDAAVGQHAGLQGAPRHRRRRPSRGVLRGAPQHRPAAPSRRSTSPASTTARSSTSSASAEGRAGPPPPAWSRTAYDRYLEWAMAQGTTENGVFGAKLMWQYLGDFVGLLRNIPDYRDLPLADLLPAAFPDLTFVRVVRANKIRQAVSLWKAVQTASWSDARRRRAPSEERRRTSAYLEEHQAAAPLPLPGDQPPARPDPRRRGELGRLLRAHPDQADPRPLRELLRRLRGQHVEHPRPARARAAPRVRAGATDAAASPTGSTTTGRDVSASCGSGPSSTSSRRREGSGRRLWLRGNAGRLSPAGTHPLTVGNVGADRGNVTTGTVLRAEEREALLRVVTAALAANDLDSILELTATESRQAVGAASLSISRFENEQSRYRVLINVGDLGPGEETFPVNEVYEVSSYPRLREMAEAGVRTSPRSTTPTSIRPRWRSSSSSRRPRT